MWHTQVVEKILNKESATKLRWCVLRLYWVASWQASSTTDISGTIQKSVVLASPEELLSGQNTITLPGTVQSEGLSPCLLWLFNVSSDYSTNILMLQLIKEFNSSLLRLRKMLVTLFLWRHCISVHLDCVKLMANTTYAVGVSHSQNWTHGSCPNSSQSLITIVVLLCTGITGYSKVQSHAESTMLWEACFRTVSGMASTPAC